MAVVDIVFDDPFISGGSTVGTISGNLAVDYDTSKAVGTVTTTIDAGNPGAGTYTFTGTPESPLQVTHVNGNYIITGGTSTFNGFPPTNATAGPNGVVNIIWSDASQTPSTVTGSFITPGSTIDITNGNVISGTVYSDSNLAVSSSLACFAAGTLIRTVRGDVPVETLAIGDLVVTASGAQRPIKWIGRRDYHCASHIDPKAVWPVRIMAGAFSDDRPERDLFLSPQHSVMVDCLDEVLIPIKYLINGATIAQEPRETISYWHVELETHDILLAEGLATESFLDTQGRANVFDNGKDYIAAHPETPLKTLDDFCRPIVLDGPIISAVRERLVARLKSQGWMVTNDADLHVLADGVRVDGEWVGSKVRFIIPAEAAEVRICSKSFVPEEFEVASRDGRRLGVPLRAVTITDGLDVTREIAIVDESLSNGFSFVQSDAELSWRWTDGDALLPAEFWAGCKGSFFLRLDIAAERGAFRAWSAPSATGVVEQTVLDFAAHRRKIAS